MADKSGSNGMGLGMILFLIFLTLKLTNHIDWSWWWVFSPLLIHLLLATIIILVYVKKLYSNEKTYNKKSYYTDFFNRGK